MAGKSSTYELALKIAGKVDSSLKKSCQDADKYLSELGETAEKAGKIAAAAFAAATTAATALATASVKAYAECETASNSLAAATGATGEEMEAMNEAMKTVYADNYGESMQDVADTVALVNRNMKNVPVDQIDEATKAAISLRDAFDYSAEETTRAAAAMEKNFGTAATDAFSLIAAGAQNGLDYSGELIDTINEYSSQFSKLGFTADGMFNLLQSGADSTAWNLDKVGDAVKEFSIRSIDGSDSTKEAFQALGYNASETMAIFAAGGDTANEAFFDVLDTLMDVDNEVKRDAIGVALFGTMWEDLGTEAMQTMADASQAAYDASGALEQINAVQYGGIEASMQGVKRQAEMIMVSVGEQLAPYVQEVLTYLAEDILPQVSAALEEIVPKVINAAKWIWENRDAILAIAAGIGTAVAAYKIYKTAITAYNAVMAVYKVVTAASAAGTFTLAGAMTALNLPVLAVCAAIGAVVAIVILCVKHWDKLKAAAAAAWEWIKKIWATAANWFNTKVIQPVVNFFQPIVQTISGIFQGLWIIIQAVWKVVSTWFNSHVIQPLISFFAPIIETIGGFFSGLWEKIVGVWSAAGTWFNEHVAEPIKEAFQIVSDFAKGIFNGLIGIVEGLINRVISGINSLIGGFSNIVGKAASFLGIDWGGIAELPEVSLPRLAVGGIATAPTLAQIGEGGEPEAVLPLSKLADLLDKWTKPKPDGGGGTQGGGDQITFAPVFQFYGPTSKEEAVEAGRVSFAEFKRLYKQMKAEEARKSFSPA